MTAVREQIAFTLKDEDGICRRIPVGSLIDGGFRFMGRDVRQLVEAVRRMEAVENIPRTE